MNSGIYQITCKPTGDFYIGSTVNFKTRKASHWCEMRKMKKKGLWGTLLLKYSIEDFEFSVLEITDTSSKTLLEVENKWLRQLNPSLNLSKEASFRPYQYGSKNPMSKHSEEEIYLLFKTIAESPWKSLSQIDRDLGFCRGTACKVARGTRYKHFKEIDPELYDLVVSGGYQTLVLLDPFGEIKEFIGSITSIARQIGVHDTQLFDVFYGKIKYAKGWRLYF